MADESDPEVSEAIMHSRREEGAHDTKALDLARQFTADANRPLTDEEKRVHHRPWRDIKRDHAGNRTDPDEQMPPEER